MSEYKCAECGGVFETGWSDEEAKAEFKQNFGRDMDPEDDAVICDDCFQKIMATRYRVSPKI